MEARGDTRGFPVAVSVSPAVVAPPAGVVGNLCAVKQRRGHLPPWPFAMEARGELRGFPVAVSVSPAVVALRLFG
jgi:hypothetical protein